MGTETLDDDADDDADADDDNVLGGFIMGVDNMWTKYHVR